MFRHLLVETNTYWENQTLTGRNRHLLGETDTYWENLTLTGRTRHLLGEPESPCDVSLPVSHVEQEEPQEHVKHHPVDIVSQLQTNGHPHTDEHCQRQVNMNIRVTISSYIK